MTIMQHMDELARRIQCWAERQETVQTLLWAGSYARRSLRRGSDLDVLVVARPDASLQEVATSLAAEFGEELSYQIHLSGGRKRCLFVGRQLLKIDLTVVASLKELDWLIKAPDVPEPRAVVSFDRSGLAVSQLDTGHAGPRNLEGVVNDEVEKFLEAFEACSAAHFSSDAYAFYFQYNLALGRLARLVEISRGDGLRLYLPKQLTNSRLPLPERQSFIDLAGTMDLKQGNAAKQRLARAFLATVGELAPRYELSRSPVELEGFLDAIFLRDYFLNVRDWAECFGGRVKPGQLIRASTLTRWQNSPHLGHWLQMNSVSTIIDLRWAGDGEDYLPSVLEGIEYVRLPLLDAPRSTVAVPMSVEERSQWYAEVVVRAMPRIARVLQVVCSSAGATVVHCNAGRDRTGWVFALLGLLLELPRHDIIDDYMATGIDVDELCIERLLTCFEENGGALGLLTAAGLRQEDIQRLKERLLIPE